MRFLLSICRSPISEGEETEGEWGGGFPGGSVPDRGGGGGGGQAASHRVQRRTASQTKGNVTTSSVVIQTSEENLCNLTISSRRWILFWCTQKISCLAQGRWVPYCCCFKWTRKNSTLTYLIQNKYSSSSKDNQETLFYTEMRGENLLEVYIVNLK